MCIRDRYHEELLKNQEIEKIEDIASESKEISLNQETSESLEKVHDNTNDLREFGVDNNEPDLFSSNDDNSGTDDLLSSSNDENEDDDLEIPAFLRRQKN